MGREVNNSIFRQSQNRCRRTSPRDLDEGLLRRKSPRDLDEGLLRRKSPKGLDEGGASEGSESVDFIINIDLHCNMKKFTFWTQKIEREFYRDCFLIS